MLAANSDNVSLGKAPHVARPTLMLYKLVSTSRTEMPTSLPDGFVGHNCPAFGEHLRDVAQAHGEPVVGPYSVGIDFTWKAASMIQGLSSGPQGWLP